MGAFAAWFGAGGNALAALRLGEGKHEVAERTLANSLLMLVVVPLVLTVVSLAFLDPVLDFLGATDSNRQLSRDFCHVILLGFVLQAVGAGLSNFVRTDGAPAYALLIMFVGTVVSCALNWLFVMVLRMGMTGSALATVAGQAVTTAMVVQYFLSKRCKLRLRAEYLKPDSKLIGNIAILGLSTFLVQVAGALTSSMLNLQITALGPTDPVGADGGLAAIGTVNKVIQLLFFVIMGFSVAAQPILGFNYGAQSYRRVRKTLWITVISAIVVNLVLWALCRAFCDQIMMFFGLTSGLLGFAETTLMLMTLMFPVVPFQVVCANYFQATGQPLKATLLDADPPAHFLPALPVHRSRRVALADRHDPACLPACGARRGRRLGDFGDGRLHRARDGAPFQASGPTQPAHCRQERLLGPGCPQRRRRSRPQAAACRRASSRPVSAPLWLPANRSRRGTSSFAPPTKTTTATTPTQTGRPTESPSSKKTPGVDCRLRVLFAKGCRVALPVR